VRDIAVKTHQNREKMRRPTTDKKEHTKELAELPGGTSPSIAVPGVATKVLVPLT
jgi:hypothetical protein